ncbi:MAG: hypothetical protein ACR2LL_13685 [Nitrosopumilus sp.]
MEGATASETEQMILLLLLNKTFKICNELPAKTRKILVIDESWMLLRMKNAAKYVNMIVRRAGNSTSHLDLFHKDWRISQKKMRLELVKLLIIWKQIILGLEEQTAETAGDVLRLSESETNKIRAFNAGHALFFTKNHEFTQSLRQQTRKRRCLIQDLNYTMAFNFFSIIFNA